jgi:nucleotide-binding universal stress UspA family protein
MLQLTVLKTRKVHKKGRAMSSLGSPLAVLEVMAMTRTMEKTEEQVFISKMVLENKRVQLSNILMGTDFSPASDRALEYALSLARRYEARIFLTHVITSDANVMVAPEIVARTYETDIRAAQERMGAILISRQLRGVFHETLIEHGSLWPTLEALISKHYVDLLVVGTQGTGGLEKILLGSGAEQIFRQAKCPVLTVGPAATGGAPKEIEFKNILFATDFGPGAERQAVYAFSFAEDQQANLTLLHVVARAEDYSEDGLALKRAAVTRELRELVPPGGEIWCRPVFRMRLGDPVEEVLYAAREMKADLVVIGAKHGKGLAAGHVPHTFAYRVVCGAPCPVLTVRS